MLAALLLFGIAAAVAPFAFDGGEDHDDNAGQPDLPVGNDGIRMSPSDEIAAAGLPDVLDQIDHMAHPPKADRTIAFDTMQESHIVTLDTWDTEITLPDGTDEADASLSFRTGAGDAVSLTFPGETEVPIDNIMVKVPSDDGELTGELPLSTLLAVAEPIAACAEPGPEPAPVILPTDPDSPEDVPPPPTSDRPLAPVDADDTDLPPSGPFDGEALQPVVEDDAPIAGPSSDWAVVVGSGDRAGFGGLVAVDEASEPGTARTAFPPPFRLSR
jgi:hypothetical protein